MMFLFLLRYYPNDVKSLMDGTGRDRTGLEIDLI